MITNENYRGTGKTKAECQAEVDVAIERFKAANTGPVLVRWVDNIADDEGVDVAKRRMRDRGAAR